jgi:hypothetical protein
MVIPDKKVVSNERAVGSIGMLRPPIKYSSDAV